MVSPYLSDDPLTKKLKQHQFKIIPVYLNNLLVEIGGRFCTTHTLFEYRYEQDNETLIIILYQRLVECSGLRSGYQEFHWFIGQAIDVGAKWIKGMIDPHYQERVKNGLSVPRMCRFYEKCYGATPVEGEGYGGNWWGLDVDAYLQRRDLPPYSNAASFKNRSILIPTPAEPIIDLF